MVDKRVSLDVNFYRTKSEGVVSFNAVLSGYSVNGSREGAYEQEKILPEILNCIKGYDIKKIYLRSLLPPNSEELFRKVENNFLTQIGNSLKKPELEVRVVLNKEL